MKIQSSQRGLSSTLQFQKNFVDSLRAFSDWLRKTQAKVENEAEIKLELYEKKSQLARLVFDLEATFLLY